jgi:orotidine-5'-phosphate decarboxylase
MTRHFADRLAEAVQARGNPLCVGLDPRWESLPLEVRKRYGSASRAAVSAAIEEFCSRVLNVVSPLVPVVKPQAAFFEVCGPEGFAVLQRILKRARDKGLLTILDGKRNDIGSTASAYAEAAFGVWEADAVTVNPYLGEDAVQPFLIAARRSQAGVFVLVRTSNPGAGLFQDLECAGKAVYRHVGAAVANWAAENLGACGLGDVGAVVGATYPAELALLRRDMPGVIFLVPGYGAQGASAADTAGAFRPDGLGAVVNSSRGVLFPFQPDDPAWEARVEAACRAAVAELAPLARPG